MTLKAFGLLLLSTLAVSLRLTIERMLMTLVGEKFVEYSVLRALKWLSKRTKSKIDDRVVRLVEKSLKGDSPS